MPRIAELICQRCHEVSYSRLPRHRAETMPPCELCGGRRQVTRVMHDRRRERGDVVVERRREG